MFNIFMQTQFFFFGMENGNLLFNGYPKIPTTKNLFVLICSWQKVKKENPDKKKSLILNIIFSAKIYDGVWVH